MDSQLEGHRETLVLNETTKKIFFLSVFFFPFIQKFVSSICFLLQVEETVRGSFQFSDFLFSIAFEWVVNVSCLLSMAGPPPIVLIIIA